VNRLKAISGFLVDKRHALLITFAVMAAVCLLLMTKVNVITDMSKYLPDDSSMHQGLQILKKQFPDVSMSDTTMRVMFTGLDGEEQSKIEKQLQDMKYVKSVAYNSGDKDYQKGRYSLFELTIPYTNASQQVAEVKDSLDSKYSAMQEDGKMVYQVSHDTRANIEPWILVLVVAILLAILLVMCSSWLEPFLFLAAIGTAVLINMGTNAFLPGVSQTTHAIAALLQLVLSMDYSIILMNRYRQELVETPDRIQAMKQALEGLSPLLPAAR
jgi:predicted RND superfamily exporter protein